MQTAPANRVIRWVITACLMFLFCTVGRLAIAQTERDLGGRFKKVTTFEIRPGTLVFPTLEANGAVCRMVVEKRGYVDLDHLNTDPVIPEMVADELVDELVPVEERGKKSKYPSPRSYVASGAYFFKQDYENISVTMYGVAAPGRGYYGTRAILIEWLKRDCPPLKAGSRFKKVETLEIRPGINVFPTFAANGSVCRMIVERRGYIDPHYLAYSYVIPAALADQLVDELVPPKERGKPSKFRGESWLAQQDYENVSVTQYKAEIVGEQEGREAIVIEWPKRDCLPLKAETKSDSMLSWQEIVIALPNKSHR